MLRVVLDFQKNDRFNSVGLYIALEQVSKGYLESGDMDEGDGMPIPLESGATLHMRFFKKFSNLTVTNSDGEKRTLIDTNDSYAKEYGKLDTLAFALKNLDLGLGFRFPSKMRALLNEVRVGEVLVAENGAEYVCTGHDGPFVKMSKRTGASESVRLSDLQSNETFLDVDNVVHMQDFYRQTMDPFSADVRGRLVLLSNAQEFLNSIVAKAKGSPLSVTVGAERLCVAYNSNTRALEWTDESGRAVSEEDVKALVAWYAAAPTVVKQPVAETEDPVNAGAYTEAYLSSEAFAEGFYDIASGLSSASELYDACVAQAAESGHPLLFATYATIGGVPSTAATFEFAPDGATVCHSHCGNDITRPTSGSGPFDRASFTKIAEEKFGDGFFRLKSEHREELKEEAPGIFIKATACNSEPEPPSATEERER